MSKERCDSWSADRAEPIKNAPTPLAPNNDNLRVRSKLRQDQR